MRISICPVIPDIYNYKYIYIYIYSIYIYIIINKLSYYI